MQGENFRILARRSSLPGVVRNGFADQANNPRRVLSSELTTMAFKYHTRTALSLAGAAALSLAFATPSAMAAVVFADDFSGASADLDGAAPDVGPGSWVAASTFNQDGSVDPSPGSATLAFTPIDGNIYQLDLSLSGVSGDQNWFALGFGSGQSNATGTNNRFINGALIGTAWMLFRGNTNGHQAFRGSASSGTANGVAWSALGTETGAIDMRIELDTTGGAGAWEATWLARLPTDVTYTEVRPTATLLDEGINSVGFALANAGVDGTVEAFSLTVVPEPSAIALLGLGGLVMMRRRR
jgi:hypothetical protein